MRRCVVWVSVLIASTALWAQDDRAEVRIRVQVDGDVQGVKVAPKEDAAKDADDAKADTKDAGGAKKDAAKPDKDDAKVNVIVKVQGISIRKPTEQERQRRQRWFGMGNLGTTVTVSVYPSSGRFIGINSGKSKLRVFSDDLGTMLVRLRKNAPVKKDGGLPTEGDWLREWRRGDTLDGSYSVQIGGPEVPAEGAMTLTVNAEVLMTWAKKEKTVKVKDVKLKPGTKVNLGMTEMEVTEIPAGWGNREGFGLKYVEKGEPLKCRIRNFRFIKPDGTEMPRRGGGSSSSGNAGNMTVTQYFMTGEKLDKITIEFTYWDQTQQLRVPIDLTTGIGF